MNTGEITVPLKTEWKIKELRPDASLKALHVITVSDRGYNQTLSIEAFLNRIKYRLYLYRNKWEVSGVGVRFTTSDIISCRNVKKRTEYGTVAEFYKAIGYETKYKDGKRLDQFLYIDVEDKC